jgi:hypothetical protein
MVVVDRIALGSKSEYSVLPQGKFMARLCLDLYRSIL